MKKFAPFLILLLLVLVFWEASVDAHNFHMDFDGDEFEGPVGALFSFLFGSVGLFLGVLVAVLVGLVLAVVFASVGVLLIAALALAAVIAVLAVSPLLLPILVPVGLTWYFLTRSRRQRLKAQPA